MSYCLQKNYGGLSKFRRKGQWEVSWNGTPRWNSLFFWHDDCLLDSHSSRVSLRVAITCPPFTSFILRTLASHFLLSFSACRISHYRTQAPFCFGFEGRCKTVDASEWYVHAALPALLSEFLRNEVAAEPVFGSTLQAICQHEHSMVPRFIQLVTEVIESRGLDTDGLYRVSGNLSAIQKIRCHVDQGNCNCFVDQRPFPNFEFLKSILGTVWSDCKSVKGQSVFRYPYRWLA